MRDLCQNPKILRRSWDLIRPDRNELILAGDETMINIHKVYKCFVPEHGGIAMEEPGKQIPHIAGMIMHSATGATVPPFVIAPLLRTPTKNIIE
jgi:hypothetical protein